jgi:hypothetical protein
MITQQAAGLAMRDVITLQPVSVRNIVIPVESRNWSSTLFVQSFENRRTGEVRWFWLHFWGCKVLMWIRKGWKYSRRCVHNWGRRMRNDAGRNIEVPSFPTFSISTFLNISRIATKGAS